MRKILPYLFFVALGALMLYGHDILLAATSALHPAPTVEALSPATRTQAAFGDPQAQAIVAEVEANATSAQVAAEQQASGWVPSGTVGSKFVTAAGALVLFVILIWRLQILTHPEPSRWAKTEYTADFKSLSPVEKFEVYGRMRLQYVLLAAASLLFAALVV